MLCAVSDRPLRLLELDVPAMIDVLRGGGGEPLADRGAEREGEKAGGEGESPAFRRFDSKDSMDSMGGASYLHGLEGLLDLQSLVQWLLSAEHATLATSVPAPAPVSGDDGGGGGGGGGRGTVTKVNDLRLGRVVGVGAFGVVRVGRHRWSGERYAVKLIPRRFVEAKQLWRHTRREAAALAAVSSPFVLRVHCAQVGRGPWPGVAGSVSSPSHRLLLLTTRAAS